MTTPQDKLPSEEQEQRDPLVKALLNLMKYRETLLQVKSELSFIQGRSQDDLDDDAWKRLEGLVFYIDKVLDTHPIIT